MSEDLELLESLVEGTRPDLEPLVRWLKAGELTETQAEPILDFVGELLLRDGVSDGELNEYGLRLDTLISVVQDRAIPLPGP